MAINKKQLPHFFVPALLGLMTLTSLFSCSAGNDGKYEVKNCTSTTTGLTGKTFYWLGSSVTLGMESGNEAVPDYLAARNGATCVKEAVSGTTLIDEPHKTFFGSDDSYITRMKNGKNFKADAKVDAFFCQISTNDAKEENKSKWGAISEDNVTSLDRLDSKTTCGAIETVIAYASQTWHCPIYFWSGSYIGQSGIRCSEDPSSNNYSTLIADTKEAVAKWNQVPGISVKTIDLFHDSKFNSITDDKYQFYMHDPVHPFKAGYLEWWTPYFESFLADDFRS